MSESWDMASERGPVKGKVQTLRPVVASAVCKAAEVPLGYALLTCFCAEFGQPSMSDPSPTCSTDHVCHLEFRTQWHSD